MASTLLTVFAVIILAEFALERFLNYLNQQKRSKTLPDSLKGIYDEEKYRNFQAYSESKDRLGNLESTLGIVASLAMLFGGFALVDGWVHQLSDSSIVQALLFFGIIAIGSDILGTPFSIYFTFVIEERFGFNKTTVNTYVADKLKGYVLGAIVGGGLLSLFVWFYESFPDLFWLYAWAAFFLFSLFLTMFYTNLIVPMFNKLTPLPDGELRSAIEAYAARVKFPLQNIMVIDGSKRSTKANAYFSGLGKSKNIVLYDTLIEKHSIPELVSILAHEVGHYKKKHTLQALFLSAINMLLTLYLLSLVVSSAELSSALGAGQWSFHLGLVAFSLLYSPISTVTGLLFNVLSRKNEFEADAYAAQTSDGNALMTSLKKLSVDTLSNLTPHPAYVFFHYSHPPLLKRLAALQKA